MHFRAHACFRLMALLLASFQMLAAGRALVPNLCLTQRDAATQEAEREGAGCTSQSCCDPQPVSKSDKGKPAAPGPENGRCPFCFLSKALVEAPESLRLELPAHVADAPYENTAGRGHRDIACGLLPGRAPPLAA